LKVSHLQLILGIAMIHFAALGESHVSERLSKPSYDDLGKDQKLAPLFAGKTNEGTWEKQRPALCKRWDQLLGKPNFASGDYEKTATPFLPISAPFNGALKRPTPKANFLAPAKALRDGDGARKPKP
jgi:hypothetical protein|tara:strand:- start:962 stop:1342 length:381 start_codon:yes stop_codon:yes gene_type:complete